jgi:hypothetical protein
VTKRSHVKRFDDVAYEARGQIVLGVEGVAALN